MEHRHEAGEVVVLEPGEEEVRENPLTTYLRSLDMSAEEVRRPEDEALFDQKIFILTRRFARRRCSWATSWLGHWPQRC